MTLGVLRHREFRLLFAGQAASVLGDRIAFVALALYVTEIGSSTDVGLVLGAQSLVFVAFLLVGGVWADRLPRQRVIIATDLLRGALHALLAVLIATGAVEIWHIVVIEALFGVGEAFFRPAHTGLVPQTVPEEDIQGASAVRGTVDTVGELLGPALAAALVVGVGASAAFALDALTFAVSAAFLWRLRPRPRGDIAAAEEPRPLRLDLRDGWHEVRSRTWVWATIACASVALLFALAPFFTLGPVIAADVHDDAAVYGYVFSAMGGGSLLGMLVAIRWRPLHPMRAAYLSVLWWPAVFVAYALGAPLVLVLPAFVAAGFGFSLFIVWWETALAERIPAHRLSRVASFDWMGSLALMPLGYVAAGPLADAFGSVDVLVAGGIVAVAAQLAGLAVPDTWRLRRLEPATA